MSIRQHIVVVNEFSVKKPDGSGSRGATPGDYVTRYMAREQATESLAPIQRLRTDDFILRYMARESAVERAGHNRSAIKAEMRQAQGNGGVAFGYGTASLSDDQLVAASRDIQRLFDEGKTVMKTVLSFDEAYLIKHGIVDKDFRCTSRGDYRGHIDQMKLRMAMMHGLTQMSQGNSGFDDLRYVGVIQVDTEHVHVHLAMADAGVGQRAVNGQQRGKLLDRHKSRLRRGVDAWLDEKQAVAHLSSAVGYERRNVTAYIKRWAYERMHSEALPQFLISCLPQDRQLWRAGSHDKRMRKASELVTDLVIEQLERPGSPLPAAMEKVAAYADQRREREGLNTEQWQRLVADGRREIIERSVNGVYQMLRSLPADELRIRTPMLEVMSMDYEQMAALAASPDRDADPDTDLVGFGFRLRSYASRLEHHRDKATLYRDLSRQWENADRAGVAGEESRPLYDFYCFEAEYQRQLMAKYQHFLPVFDTPSTWYQRQRELADYGSALVALRQLRGDQSLGKMKDGAEAEALGREIYDQPGGRLLTQGAAGRSVLDQRIQTMQERYQRRLDELRADLVASGLVLRPAEAVSVAEPGCADQRNHIVAGELDAPGGFVIEKGEVYPFSQVRALDLHHLGVDFHSDVSVDAQATRDFIAVSTRRRALLLGAMGYLDNTGQSAAIADLPVEDVSQMLRCVKRLEQSQRADGSSVLSSQLAELRARQQAEQLQRSATASLDASLVVRVQAQVDTAATTFSAPDEVEKGLGYEANGLE